MVTFWGVIIILETDSLPNNESLLSIPDRWIDCDGSSRQGHVRLAVLAYASLNVGVDLNNPNPHLQLNLVPDDAQHITDKPGVMGQSDCRATQSRSPLLGSWIQPMPNFETLSRPTSRKYRA